MRADREHDTPGDVGRVVLQEAASPGQPSRHSSAPQSHIAALPEKEQYVHLTYELAAQLAYMYTSINIRSFRVLKLILKLVSVKGYNSYTPYLSAWIA